MEDAGDVAIVGFALVGHDEEVLFDVLELFDLFFDVFYFAEDVAAAALGVEGAGGDEGEDSFCFFEGETF